MELTPARARIMMIRWTVFPVIMGILAIVVFTSGNNPVLGWVLAAFCLLGLAFRVYLSRIVRQSPDDR